MSVIDIQVTMQCFEINNSRFQYQPLFRISAKTDGPYFQIGNLTQWRLLTWYWCVKCSILC